MISSDSCEVRTDHNRVKAAISQAIGDRRAIGLLIPKELKYIDEGNHQKEVINKKGESKMTKVSDPRPVIRKAYYDTKCEMEDGMNLPKGEYFLTVIASQMSAKIKENCRKMGVDDKYAKAIRIAENVEGYRVQPDPERDRLYKDGTIQSDVARSESRTHDKES